ncbi:proteasome subunit alpha [Zafaria sp. Z1313]|uniref:proteasome subunit alpha n=1 Tax=unclassified Zafaria TaxID=2828765 RepID=UPI002E7666BC|nr:proteasome subunit alpha [Zafaria sp. J156]MEE1621210.1 proteasome subunit alpha [Zafaria sp. J156]
MPAQFYVSPEQLMKDRADFARKGIARGRSVVVASCSDGIALVAENPSSSLRKIGEIYDRIAFAAVGRYNEFESLRQVGVRYADTRGYSYDREDVTARGLASAYAQSLGAAFMEDAKPFEVELAVAEIGAEPSADHLFRIRFDGSISDESGFVVMGGDAEVVGEAMGAAWAGPGPDDGGYAGAVRAAAASLPGVAAGTPGPRMLEVAVLDRDPLALRGKRRAFRRLDTGELGRLLAAGPPRRGDGGHDGP